MCTGLDFSIKIVFFKYLHIILCLQWHPVLHIYFRKKMGPRFLCLKTRPVLPIELNCHFLSEIKLVFRRPGRRPVCDIAIFGVAPVNYSDSDDRLSLYDIFTDCW